MSPQLVLIPSSRFPGFLWGDFFPTYRRRPPTPTKPRISKTLPPATR
jgi:hypothetical protein